MGYTVWVMFGFRTPDDMMGDVSFTLFDEIKNSFNLSSS